MGKYILKRMAYMLIVVWAVSLIAFVLLRLAPSDAATLALPATCSIALTAAVIILFISIPLGIIAGVNQGSAVDFLCTFIVVLLQSMAVVWVCILLLLIFTVKFNLLPAMGYKGFSAPQYLIMPIIASGYRLMTSLTRMDVPE